MVIQHLSPDHKSMMEQLLARHTPMPVTMVEDGLLLQGGRVYLLPPAHVMSVDKGRLRLAPKPSKALTLPIDLFFSSLARSYGHGADRPPDQGLAGVAGAAGGGSWARRRAGRGRRHLGHPGAGAQRWRLTGQQLKLELTESDIMRHPKESLQTLEPIRAMGVRIAVDDFGTGFSSLSYLRTLPLDTLKIDRSFVSSLLVNGNSQSIVSMIVSRAKSCGYNIVAEGVETQEQSDALRAPGVEYLQGWLYARSVPEERRIEVLAALPRLS